MVKNMLITRVQNAASRFAVASIFGLASLVPFTSSAEQVCVEEAAGVCLKYKTVAPKRAAPAQPARPAGPTFANTPEAEVEKGLNLNRNEYRFVQSGLQKAGYYKGGIDGVMGGGSRKALAAWQAENGVDATGYLTFEQAIALQEGRSLTAAPSAPTAEVSAPAVEAAPSHPFPGRTYEARHSVYPGSTVFGDAFIRLTRTSETEGILEIEYVDASQSTYSFRDQCVVSLEANVTCSVRARGGYWRVTGDLPVLSLNGGSFAKTFELW